MTITVIYHVYRPTRTETDHSRLVVLGAVEIGDNNEIVIACGVKSNVGSVYKPLDFRDLCVME